MPELSDSMYTWCFLLFILLTFVAIVRQTIRHTIDPPQAKLDVGESLQEFCKVVNILAKNLTDATQIKYVANFIFYSVITFVFEGRPLA